MSGYLNITLVPKSRTTEDKKLENTEEELLLLSFSRSTSMYEYFETIIPYASNDEVKPRKITSNDIQNIISELQATIDSLEDRKEELLELAKANTEYYEDLLNTKKCIIEDKEDMSWLNLLHYIVTETENNFNDFEGIYMIRC